jgi:hypothetical protein
MWPRIRERLGDSARAFSTNARSSNLRRAQLSFGASWTAEWALMVAIGVVAFRDGGAAAVGIVAFIRMAPSTLFAPMGTALGDRLPREQVLLWSCLLRAVTIGLAALLLATSDAVIGVYALTVIATAGFTVFRPVHSALLPALAMTPLELTSANVVRGLLDSFSVLLGPAAAALLLDLEGPASAFALSAGLSLWSGLLLLRLSYEAPPRGAPRPLRRVATEIVEGFRVLVRYRDTGLVIGLALAQTLTRGCFNVFVVVLALDLLDTGEPGVGVLTAAVGVGAVVGSLGASFLVSGRRLAVVEGFGVALWGLPLTLSGAFASQPAVLVLMCVIGIGNALVDVGLYTVVQRTVPDSLLARVFGALESLTALTVALGSLITPVAIELLGIRGALVVLGLVAPALAVLAWRRLRTIDSLIAHRDEEIGVLKRVGMLRPLPMPAIESLAAHVSHTVVPAGQEVFNQGDTGDRFYVVEDGEADVIGDGRFIRTMKPGDGFGEIALLRGTPRTTTVLARTSLRLYSLHRNHFLSAVSGYASSGSEADHVVVDRLAAFSPREGRASS